MALIVIVNVLLYYRSVLNVLICDYLKILPLKITGNNNVKYITEHTLFTLRNV